jgi:surfeit locus 1 family protein
MPQSFAKVALTPKWIGALLLALAVAAVFALLGQWQLGRALTTVGNKHSTKPAVTLESLTKPGEGFKTSLTNRKVTAKITTSEFLGIVGNRVQKEGNRKGFWSIALATLEDGSHLVIAYDFEEQPTTQTAAPKNIEITGRYIPSEDPAPKTNPTFDSLSVQQLINQPGITETPTFAGAVAIEKPINQPILISDTSSTEINALNAFYAIEWTLFAGFAVFLWWRMVQDERLGLRAER